MLRKLIYLVLFIMTAWQLSQAQTQSDWFTLVAAEDSTVSVVLPANTTYRIGNASFSCWRQVTTTKITTLNPVSFAVPNNFGYADPCPNVVKELDILEITSNQTISVFKGTVTSTITVPAQPAVVVTPPPVPIIKMKLICSGNPISVILYTDNSWEISSSAGSCAVAQ